MKINKPEFAEKQRRFDAFWPIFVGKPEAGDWFHSAGAPGPCDRVPRKLAPWHHQFVFGLLSPIANASLLGEGLAQATIYSGTYDPSHSLSATPVLYLFFAEIKVFGRDNWGKNMSQ